MSTRWSPTHLPPTSAGRARLAATTSDPYLLDALAQDPSPWVRKKVGYNRHAPAEVLLRLAADPDIGVRYAAACHPRCPAAGISLLARDTAIAVRVAIAKRDDCPVETSRLLAADPDPGIRRAILQRADSHTVRRIFTPDALLTMARSSDAYQSRRAARFASPDDRDVLDAAAASHDLWTRVDVLERPDCPDSILTRLTDDPESITRIRLASRPTSPAWLLDILAADKDPMVRIAVARHPNTGEHTLTKLARDRSRRVTAAIFLRPGGRDWCMNHPDPLVRRVAARHIRYVISDPAEQASAERAWETLATDPSAQVRLVIAHRAAAAPGTRVPRSGIDRFVDDPDVDVRVVVADSSRTPDVLDRLAQDRSPRVRRAVAGNRWTGTDSLTRLVADHVATVREQATRRFLAAFPTPTALAG